MTRINLFRNTPIRNTADGTAIIDSICEKIHFEKTTGAFLFGALLIVCSMAVGCSKDSPKTSSAINSGSSIQNSAPPMLASSSTPTAQAPTEPKPVAKKVVRKRPATLTYVDKTSGVSFEYPRRYAIETGAAATDLVDSKPLPTNFVAPGGTALVAVELPETGFANTDFSSAFFGVSVNKSLSASDCGKFALPQDGTSTSVAAPEVPASAATAPADSTSIQAAPQQVASENAIGVQAKGDAPKTETANSSEQKSDAQAEASKTQSVTPAIAPAAKVMLSEMDVQKTEAVTGNGNQQSDSKYFHVYQNNACYEFALNVTTVASQSDGDMKHIDRDKVFARLEKILATVKINPAETEKEAAIAPAPVPAQ
jgi:hypothetical protein